jgi:quercetin dioxygenase-like cupin family protein
MDAAGEIQVIDLDHGPKLTIVDGAGHANAVIWPGMGAQLRSIHMIRLEAGSRTVELNHDHEAVYHVNEGSGDAVDIATGETQPLRRGSMIHIDPGTRYRVVAGSEGMAVVGGPSPPDPALYKEGG